MQMIREKSSFRTVALCLGLLATSTLTACGGGEPNHSTPEVSTSATLVDDTFLFSITLKSLQLDVGGRYAIDAAKFPNSYFEIGPDFKSNGTLLTIGLSVKDVSSSLGASGLDPQTLPGGRPLPGVAVGAMPGMALTISKLHNMTFYFGNDAFGIFVPVNLPVKGAIATFRFYADGKRVGNASFVGQDAMGLNSGVLLLMTRDLVNTAANKKLL